MAKSNLSFTMTGEKIEYQRLYDLTGTAGRSMTTTGSYSFTSLSSGTTYSTTTGGEYAVFLQLQTALQNYDIIDTDFNNKVEVSTFNEHLAENATLAHGGLILGTLNTDLNKIKALPLKTDTRTTTLTYTSGVLTSVVDADGATTVKTTTLNYTNGVLTSVAEVAGGTTVTTTLNYTSGVLTSVTKAVA